MHALVVGATGATGKDLLHLLLNDDRFQQVDIYVRRSLDFQHEKLKVHVIDFDKPEQWTHLVKGDVLFSCLGTTLKAAGSKEAQYKVDYSYQYQFAKIARDNQVSHYVLVSSGFASADSLFYYPRMKGQLEEAVKALGFSYVTIFNPPGLIRKDSDRRGEVIGHKVLRLFKKLGMFRAYEPLATEILAQAMINVAKRRDNRLLTLKGKSIWECASANINE